MRRATRSLGLGALALFALALGAAAAAASAQASPPAWTRGATCYEVFVRSFQDSDGDGIGDIKGLTSRLDYINDGRADPHTSLGARCIWLMPVAASPSYHGYDVSDYYRVEPAYGTNADFKQLVAEAHKRGIRVLVDMVLNHSSSEHPYFKAALRDPASPYRAWYRWASRKPGELNPWGQSNWHKSPVRDEYYYGFFSERMPDLNYTNPAVRAEAVKVARFWLVEMKVDGFRLDAIPYLVEEPNAIVHSAGTHRVLRDYEAALRRIKADVYTVGEVSDSTRPMLGYYPDQLVSYFAFEVADSLIAAVRRGSAGGVLAPALRLQRDAPRERWSPFLRNHDQPRTRSELDGDLAKARAAATLLMSLPGMPFVYYGEEIGMTGVKPDERLRTPMQWGGAHESGFTTGTPWESFQHDSATVTVQSQEHDSTSLLSLYRRLVHLRATNEALAHGLLVPMSASDTAFTAWARRDGEHVVWAIANLGAVERRDVKITSVAGTLPSGHWLARDLLGIGPAFIFDVDPSGALSNPAQLPALGPRDARLYELVRAIAPKRNPSR